MSPGKSLSSRSGVAEDRIAIVIDLRSRCQRSGSGRVAEYQAGMCAPGTRLARRTPVMVRTASSRKA
ncbi:hypothetical protein GCM10020219_003740 [Nonomuraea dietziae]